MAYLKGLADGLDLDQETSRRGKLIAKIIDVLEDVGFAVEDLEVEVEALADGMESMAEDLSDVETVIFDEEDEDENGCCGSCSALDDDDFFQIACPSCGADIVIDESVLDIGGSHLPQLRGQVLPGPHRRACRRGRARGVTPHKSKKKRRYLTGC